MIARFASGRRATHQFQINTSAHVMSIIRTFSVITILVGHPFAYAAEDRSDAEESNGANEQVFTVDEFLAGTGTTPDYEWSYNSSMLFAANTVVAKANSVAVQEGNGGSVNSSAGDGPPDTRNFATLGDRNHGEHVKSVPITAEPRYDGQNVGVGIVLAGGWRHYFVAIPLTYVYSDLSNLKDNIKTFNGEILVGRTFAMKHPDRQFDMFIGGNYLDAEQEIKKQHNFAVV